MPWNKSDYPDSFKNLDDSTRNKAIEIANALLKDGHDDGSAIRIAISQAKKTTGHSKHSSNAIGGLVKTAYDYRLYKGG